MLSIGTVLFKIWVDILLKVLCWYSQRLREEVDVLQHLALTGGPTGHPNVLKYIDSWEQDDMLYIHTELCELGNFGTFLSEYGAHFEALDEARVWKICAELSNVWY